MFKASAFGKFAVYFILFLAATAAYFKIYSADTAPFLSRQLLLIMTASLLSFMMGILRYNKLQQGDKTRELMDFMTPLTNIAIDVAMFEYV